MDLVLLVNPKSGRGLARRLSRDIAERARERGHRCKTISVGSSEPLESDRLRSADALIVVGGDGTVSRCAPVAIEAGTPVYHAPTGNENLFARALGMTRHPPTLLEHIETGRVGQADIGDAGGHLFLLMASVGPDAGVIARVARARTKAIGHLAYAAPIAAECLRPHLPRVWAEVDGEELVSGDRGVLVVANTREYASRLDPCRDASLFSGQLHAVFLPASSTAGVLRWAIPAWRGRLDRAGAVVRGAGRDVRVRIDPPAGPVQIDGEHYPAAPSESAREVVLRVVPGRMSVILGGHPEHPAADGTR